MAWWKEVEEPDGSIRFARTYDARDLSNSWGLRADLGGCVISTKFIGSAALAHYETFIFKRDKNTLMTLHEERFDTREKAAAGHETLVEVWRKKMADDVWATVKDVVCVGMEYRAVDAAGATVMVMSEEGARRAKEFLRVRGEIP